MSDNSLLHAPSLSPPKILSKFAMNPTKSDEDSGEPFFHRHYHHYHNHHRQILHDEHDSSRHFQSNIPPGPPFSIYRDTDDDDNDNSSPGPSDDDPDDAVAPPSPPTLPDATPPNSQTLNSSSSADPDSIQSAQPGFVNPEPHISSQFYTFNKDSHSLMVKCLVEGRLATPGEIRVATSPEVLRSWRAVWKDRNEDTAYTTAWKRIQDKLQAHIDEHGNRFLCFKNSSSQQFVSHFNQWQDIVMSFHGDSDLKHLGLRETIERIKQVWTVGAKFYGIPESFIRVCVAGCAVCSGVGAGDGGAGGFGGGRPKRRRFEYTESFDIPAKEVPNKLQQLAKKHKVVLCIRQKYIRYKPFMAEVKDYACHRAGEPASKKSSKALKREPYASKRCGCGFRIRAIVPIANYNEKDKTFVYQDEGMAVFKLYAVHTGHEPGPLDGNARIMHRVVGQKGGFLMEQETEYGVNEVVESDDVVLSGLGVDEGDFRLTVMHQLQELKHEVGLLESKIGKAPHELLGSVSRDLYDIVNKVRLLGDEATKPSGLLSNNKPHSDVLLRNGDLNHWSDAHTEGMYVDGKDTDLIDDDDDSFGRTLNEVAPWDEVGGGCRSEKDMISEACKAEKWLNSSEFDEKSILHSQGSKLAKSISLTRHDDDDSIDTDVGLGIQVDSFYPENPKWYDSPCGLDSGTDCGESGFRHGEIV